MTTPESPVMLTPDAAQALVVAAMNYNAPRSAERPTAEDKVVGICPECGSELVSRLVYSGSFYVCYWACWESEGAEPVSCGYRRVI